MKDGLFESIRKQCKPAVWSRGVEIHRAGQVSGESIDEDEAVFLIAERGGMISRSVSFFLDDDDWDCECDSRHRVCEHVAAATIAWRRADERGEGLPKGDTSSGRIGYRFRREADRLTLERVIVIPDDEVPLETTIAAVATGRVQGPRCVATQDDLAVELALETHRRGTLPKRIAARVLGRMSGCSDVRLDGEPVRTASEACTKRVVVEDQGEGFRLRLAEAEGVAERFANGVVLCDGVLRPTSEPRLTGRELNDLPRGVTFPPEQVATLITEVLPDLRRRIPVDVRTTRLPGTESEPPRIQLVTSRDGDDLEVLALLVYGDPPRARIDAGRIVHLEGAVPARDERAEKALLRRLQRDLQLSPGIRARFHGAEAVAFTRRCEQFEGCPAEGALAEFALAPPLTPRLEPSMEAFDVAFESEGSDRPGGPSRSYGLADPERVLQAWRAGESLVPLLEGGWAPLPSDWLDRHGERIADLFAARGEDGALPRASTPDLAALCEDLDTPPPPEFGRLRRFVDDFEGIPHVTLPEDLRATLRGYQRRGVDWLSFLRDIRMGALLADDMGLGKTVQAMCAFRGRTLVVAPTSVLQNWAEEIEKFRPGLDVAVYHGPGRRLDGNAAVTLTTYAILRLDADALASETFDTVVLDESQAIKNPDSQVAAAAHRLRAQFRIALTGTPVENRLEELWSQFHFLNRGLLGGRRDFEQRYAGPIARGDTAMSERLRDRIRPFVLRRLKEQVAPELPPRTDSVLHCVLSDREREVYDAVRAATREDVMKRLGEGGGVLAALEALLRLRQAACHAGLVPGQEADRSSKLDTLMEALDNVVAEGRKALVFSQWTSLLDRTEDYLREAAMSWTRLDGSTRDRAAVVHDFQSPDGPPVLLVSLKAGGTGINLTAADHVFLLDPWWNPAVEDQAADRAHRIGQENPVMVYRLVAVDTVEERILELQQRKRELADAALDGGGAVGGLTRDDLLDLLN